MRRKDMANNNNSADPGSAASITGAAAASNREPGTPFIARPAEVLDDPTITAEQKRAILASWLSDRHAVPDAPRWRQLDNGALMDSEDVMRALYALDDAEGNRRNNRSSATLLRSHQKTERRWLPAILTRKRDDADDDPPPSPAAMRLPVPDIADPPPPPAAMPRMVLAA